MKGCVFLIVLWFAFCATKANSTSTTTLTSTSRSTQPTTAIINSTTPLSDNSTNTTTPTSSSNSTQPTTTTTISTPTSPDVSTNTTTPTSSSISTQPTTTTTISTPTSQDNTTNTTTPTSSSNSTQPTTTTTISTPTSQDNTTNTTTPTSSSNSTQPTTTTTISTPTSQDNSTNTTTPTSSSNSTQPTTTTTISAPTSQDNSTNTTTPTSSSNSTQPTTTTTISAPTSQDNGTNTTTSTSSSNSTQPTTTTTISTPTTQVPLPCEKNPCIYGAECINIGNQQYVCQCPFGLYYTNTSGCKQGKLFPGELSLMNQLYNPSWENKNTTAYEQLFNNVTQFFKFAFINEPTFKETIILSVKQSSSTRKRLREAGRANSTVVSLINMFDMSTTLNSSTVQSLVETAVNSQLSGSSFTSTQQCNTLTICDSQTQNCTEPDNNIIATCECKKGLAKKNPQDLSCSSCADCSPKDNRQCIIKDGVPQCQCMTNSYRKGDRCQECDFGYSGENCQNNYVAIIVGVAVACGIVIVVLAGVLIYKSVRAKKNLKPERRSLLSNDYLATDIASESKSTQNVAPRQKIFPKIQVKNPAGQGEWARNTGEGSSANLAYLPDQDYDDADVGGVSEPSAFELKARSKF